MSIFSKKILPRLIPVARVLNSMLAQAGHEHVHEWDRGEFKLSPNNRPTIVQTCTLCGETRTLLLP